MEREVITGHDLRRWRNTTWLVAAIAMLGGLAAGVVMMRPASRPAAPTTTACAPGDLYEENGVRFTCIGPPPQCWTANTSIVYSSLGGYNTAIGTRALLELTTGSRNFAFGRDAGRGIVTGSDNIIVGDQVGILSPELHDTMIIFGRDGRAAVTLDLAPSATRVTR